MMVLKLSECQRSYFKLAVNLIMTQPVCDGTQNYGRYRYFFPVPNFFDTGSETFSDSGSVTFFLYQIRRVNIVLDEMVREAIV